LQSFGRVYPRRTSSSTRKPPRWVSELNLKALDKERYIKELRELTKSNKTLEKPKKPLTPYMLFVREVSREIHFAGSEMLISLCRRDQRSSEIIRISLRLIS
jgi:hypothetical protein